MDGVVELYYSPWVLFFWGACWGSFMNVVIYRYPLGKSVIHPASACPSCHQPIAIYDNIPVLSWLILRGKCRKCKASFSPFYAIVEACFGLLGAGAVLLYPDDWVKGFCLGMALIVMIPLVTLLVRVRRAPWYLNVAFSGFVGVYIAQFLL